MVLGNKVCVLGGTGFVGRAVVNALSKAGYESTVVARRPERYRDFSLYPNTRVQAIQKYNSLSAMQAAMADADIVVNLTADRSTTTETVELDEFVAVNQKIKQAAETASVKRVINLSQLGAADMQVADPYLSKLGEVESFMHTSAHCDVTTFKPSLLIGPGDDTTSRYAAQLNRLPFLMVAKSGTEVQPLAVKDFAQALVSSIKQPETYGKKMEVAGESRMTLADLAELVAELMQKDDAVVLPMCSLNAKIFSFFGEFSPMVSASNTQLVTLASDMVTGHDFSKQFGFEPAGIEWVMAEYVTPHRVKDRLNYYRKEAKRDAEELV